MAVSMRSIEPEEGREVGWACQATSWSATRAVGVQDEVSALGMAERLEGVSRVMGRRETTAEGAGRSEANDCANWCVADLLIPYAIIPLVPDLAAFAPVSATKPDGFKKSAARWAVASAD